VRGKTLLASSLAYGLHRKGRPTALIGADGGRPTVLEMTGCSPVPDRTGLWRTNSAYGSLPASSIAAGAAGPAPGLGGFETAAGQVQMVVVDAAPPVDKPNPLWRLAGLIIVVTEPGAETLQASYVAIKRIIAAGAHARLGLVVNLAGSYAEAERCYRKLSGVCRRFIKINLGNYGYMPHLHEVDEVYEKAVPLVRAYPDSEAAGCIDSILGLILMDEAAKARRRTEVRYDTCALREGR
jgi:hypothetical protein